MAFRCGLEDPDVFAAKGGVWGAPDTAPFLAVAEGVYGPRSSWPEASRMRGTGRTTRMLLQALAALEAGCTVEVVAADREQACDLLARMRDLGSAAQLAPGCTDGPLCVTYPGAAASPTPDALFVDHCVAGRSCGEFFVPALPREGVAFAALEADPAP